MTIELFIQEVKRCRFISYSQDSNLIYWETDNNKKGKCTTFDYYYLAEKMQRNIFLLGKVDTMGKNETWLKSNFNCLIQQNYI